MRRKQPERAAGTSRVGCFAQRVYACLSDVPRGRVITYAALAARVGCGSARAVGQALRRNPSAPQVPCHRVIRSDLKIGGFQGCVNGAAVERKRQLLACEGVTFDAAGQLRERWRLCR